MKKTYLLWFAFLAFLLLGCRNEDFVNQSANNRREEEFFREALSKTARIKNGNTIVAALKRQNEKSHFVSKMKDQSGLPIWDRVITIKNSNVVNKGESGSATEEYMIPLTENDKDLSSILFVTKSPDSSFSFKNLDNERLKEIVYDQTIEKSLREQLLASFIFVDHLSFSGDAVYWNLPDDLFSFIPESTLYPQRRFKVNISDTHDTGTDSEPQTNELYYYQSYILCAWTEIECTRCPNGGHSTYETDCVVIGGGGGDTGGHGTPGDTGGGGGGGNEGGSGEEEDDCSLDNKPFYKIMPGCDDDGGSNEHGGIIDPCTSIKAKFANTKFKEKYDALDKPENFDLDREKAYIMRYPPAGVNIPPSYFQVDMPPCATGNEDAVMPSNNGGLAGLMHTHTNSTCNGNYPVKVPSPVDIKYLLNTLLSQANQYTGSYANAYSITITSGGSYMLMYTGTTYPGSLNDNTVKQLKKDYTKIFQDLYTYKDNNPTQSDIEKLFTKFMKEKINKPGLEVYRVTPTSAVKIEYDPASPNSVKQTPCP